MEIKSPEDKNTADWYDKNKFKKISAIVISNKFNHKTRIGKFKYNDIRDLVDNINKNTISEKLARKNLNASNKLRNAKIKNKRLSSNQKELLKLFDDLSETISNNSNNNNNSNNSNNNENESESDNENDHDNVNDNDNENESESDNENDNDNVNESETESEDESEDKNKEYYKTKQLNGYFKMIGETKSFEKQINLFKKMNFSK